MVKGFLKSLRKSDKTRVIDVLRNTYSFSELVQKGILLDWVFHCAQKTQTLEVKRTVAWLPLWLKTKQSASALNSIRYLCGQLGI